MAKAIKICKICGKEYEYCKTLRVVPGVYRWQDVACCPEHGSEYLSLVIASRVTVPAEKVHECNGAEEAAEEAVKPKRKRYAKKQEEEL